MSSSSTALNTEPMEVYGPEGAPIALRIGNGGAGPTGVIGALARDYLEDRRRTDIAVAWVQSISRLTLMALGQGAIDIALTYERDQEQEAIDAGDACEPVTVFHDHFVVVGPSANPAGVAPDDSPAAAFRKISRLGESDPGAERFLSRDDLSGTNVKELSLWKLAGIKPFADPRPNWYVAEPVFPQDALRTADQRGLYTLTDHGTFHRTREELADSRILLSGGEALRNTCNALLRAEPTPLARDFLHYLRSARGQAVIAEFGRSSYGTPLYTPAAQPEF